MEASIKQRIDSRWLGVHWSISGWQTCALRLVAAQRPVYCGWIYVDRGISACYEGMYQLIYHEFKVCEFCRFKGRSTLYIIEAINLQVRQIVGLPPEQSVSSWEICNHVPFQTKFRSCNVFCKCTCNCKRYAVDIVGGTGEFRQSSCSRYRNWWKTTCVVWRDQSCSTHTTQ